MLEFTLSKINLLILVVALFSIISFFSINVGKIFLVGEVKQELDKYSITLNGMIVAPTTCDSKPFAIPSKFTSFGNNVYYVLHVSTLSSSEGNRLIFSASDVKQPNTVLAASSLSTRARILILDTLSGSVVPLDAGEELTLDPQAVPPTNAFYAVKSVKQGATTLYVFPCAITSTGDTCAGGGGAKERVNHYLSTLGESFVC